MCLSRPRKWPAVRRSVIPCRYGISGCKQSLKAIKTTNHMGYHTQRFQPPKPVSHYILLQGQTVSIRAVIVEWAPVTSRCKRNQGISSSIVPVVGWSTIQRNHEYIRNAPKEASFPSAGKHVEPSWPRISKLSSEFLKIGRGELMVDREEQSQRSFAFKHGPNMRLRWLVISLITASDSIGDVASKSL